MLLKDFQTRKFDFFQGRAKLLVSLFLFVSPRNMISFVTFVNRPIYISICGFNRT